MDCQQRLAYLLSQGDYRCGRFHSSRSRRQMFDEVAGNLHMNSRTLAFRKTVIGHCPVKQREPCPPCQSSSTIWLAGSP